MSDSAEQATPDVAQMEPTQQDVFNKSQDARWWEGGQKVETGAEFAPRKLQTQLDKVTRRQSGRRSRTRTDRKRGRYIKAVPANGRNQDIAFDATLRAAAIHQRARQQQKAETGMAYALRKSDLYRKIRVRRAANLILFVVDASWSMAVSERMQATKGAIMSLLTDAYQRRDRVGLIVFQKTAPHWSCRPPIRSYWPKTRFVISQSAVKHRFRLVYIWLMTRFSVKIHTSRHHAADFIAN